MPGKTSKSILFAFDFDKTIVEKDSDITISKMLGKPLPEAITKLCDGYYWVDFTNALFRYLHEEGVTTEEIAEVLRGIPVVKGIPELFQKITDEILPSSSSLSKLILVSDSNEFNISKVLSNINPELKLDGLITNGSDISSTGLLQLIPFEEQYSCKFCPKNLCKGTALMKYISENGPFSQVVYVGDGKNDVCPATKLSKNDFVWARKGYQLDEIIKAGERNGIKVDVVANVQLWNDGHDILNKI